MQKEIIQVENKILREKSEEIKLEDVSSKEIKDLVQDLKDTLKNAQNGIALSAVQIGVLKRVFVVSGKAFCESEEREDCKNPDLVLINPKIIKQSKEKEWMEEGCLSIKGTYGIVERSIKTQIEALDESGKKISRGGSGLLSQIFQHEIDHLNGVLFIDKAKEIYEEK